MADTSLNSTLVQKLWSKLLLLQAKQYSFMEKFSGKTEMDFLFEPPDISGKMVGDTAYIPLLRALTGAGVMDDADTEGQEESQVYSGTSMTFHQYAHQTRLKGEFEESKTALLLRTSAKTQLADWMARKRDALAIAGAQVNAAIADIDDAAAISTQLNIVFGGAADDWDALTSGDVLTVDLIRKAKRYALLRGLRPGRTPEGGEHLLLLISLEQEYDLVKSAGWNEAQLHANVKGPDNPIFTNKLGMVDNVIIHTHQVTINGGAAGTFLLNEDKGTHRNIQALLLGAQGVAFAYSKLPDWKEKLFQYGRKFGVSTAVIMAATKPVINLGTEAVPVNRDYGMCYVCTAATKVGG